MDNVDDHSGWKVVWTDGESQNITTDKLLVKNHLALNLADSFFCVLLEFKSNDEFLLPRSWWSAYERTDKKRELTQMPEPHGSGNVSLLQSMRFCAFVSRWLPELSSDFIPRLTGPPPAQESSRLRSLLFGRSSIERLAVRVYEVLWTLRGTPDRSVWNQLFFLLLVGGRLATQLGRVDVLFDPYLSTNARREFLCSVVIRKYYRWNFNL